MRPGRLLIAWGLLWGAGVANGQPSTVPTAGAPGPARPDLGARLPGPIVPPGRPLPSPGADPSGPAAIRPAEIPLPQPENKFPLQAGDVTLKRINGSWQVWAGQRLLRDFGDRESDARDVLRVIRDLRPTEWVTIGGPRPVVEYGLVNGQPPATLPPPPGLAPRPFSSAAVARSGPVDGGPAVTGAGARLVLPIDLQTVRVENIRGVWCLRDDATIHLNFGASRADAEQALAVVRRYGFNRLGIVGQATPVMSYFFVGHDAGPPPALGPLARAQLQAQIDGLRRVGIPVPGVGYVGEMVRIDPRKLEVRKIGGDWVVAEGDEILGRFGPGEWSAREAARVIADGRFTEFCRLGPAGPTFFLVNGAAPTRVPLAVQGRRFDPSGLKVVPFGATWAVTENGRHLFDCATAEEGEILVRVIRHFGFDQLCHVGPSPRAGISFLARSR